MDHDERAVTWSRRLRERGFDVRPIRPPTVPEGEACLRAAHTERDMERLVEAMEACCRAEDR